jgi:hypothetical protein
MVISIKIPKEIFEIDPITLQKAKDYYLEAQLKNYLPVYTEDLWFTLGRAYYYDQKNTSLFTELLPETNEVLVTGQLDEAVIHSKREALHQVTELVDAIHKQLKDLIRKI